MEKLSLVVGSQHIDVTRHFALAWGVNPALLLPMHRSWSTVQWWRCGGDRQADG
jgi:hypothetical protein